MIWIYHRLFSHSFKVRLLLFFFLSNAASVVMPVHASLYIKCFFRADPKNRIEQELANDGPRTKSGLLPIFVWLATRMLFTS